ncbi:glycosyltransferase family 4 protein [Microbacterium arborescens]|uniref:glycosyltransferase family 4 protein n=1 Tax=Microbacterium arborescens TaxID=33883 RepID=UPI0025A2946F|nr:glycosyltransferase family 4 protein [Microbacterium arborescens]WJM17338.1 glycosyltransferase family 4 protein [Microbacterium arborescens]
MAEDMRVSVGSTPPSSYVALARAQFASRPPALAVAKAALTWDEWSATRVISANLDTPVLSGVIWATDRPTSRRRTAQRLLMQRILRRARGLWVLSEAQLPHLQQWLGPGAPTSRYIRFGIDEDFFQLADYPSDPLIVSVGGDRDRDTASLYKALGSVADTHPAVRAIVQTSSPLPPPPNTTAVPHLSHIELRELYRRATVVVVATLPNLHASGMTVSLEAMATGRPVVITATPGLEDYIEDGATGTLVRSHEPQGLARAISRYLDAPAAAAEAGKMGREKVLRDHRSTSMAAELAKFARQVLRS